MGKQMIRNGGAQPLTSTQSWKSINWKKAQHEVRRLQMRIAKAVQEGKYGRVQALQWILTHSFYAKALAVKRVTSNKGKKTPGVDGVLWKTASDKWQAIHSLRQHGYKALPLRRIYIPKKNGKKRPLSIPTMYDRAMQALYKLALAPVAETTADRNSYGFREMRSCADAISAGFNALSKPNSATWVYEADITGCFDNIFKSWLMENIPMEKRILKQWLDAGYMENRRLYPTRKGVPQGGVISPTLANMALDGLEQAIIDAVPRRSRVNFDRYADDFIVTAKSKAIIDRYIRPTAVEFLAIRGLKLSEEKSLITHIKSGFTFLGQTFRKTGNTLHITPSKEGVLHLIRKVGMLIHKYTSAPIVILIKKLNEALRGWANYHRHVVSSEAFQRVDTYVYEQLWRMIHRRHPNKSKKWLANKYWLANGMKWLFSTRYKTESGKKKVMHVIRTSSIGIRRHKKIKADANPYLAEYGSYFYQRRHNKESKFLLGLTSRQTRLALQSR